MIPSASRYVSPLRSDTGAIVGVVGLDIDVTDMQEM